jgi:hypothetical protein
MEQWLKILDRLAHKRAGVIIAAIAAIAFADLPAGKDIVIMAGAAIYTLCQTISDGGKDGE